MHSTTSPAPAPLPAPALSAAPRTHDASLEELGARLWRRRGTIGIGALIGGTLALLPTFFRPATWTSTATVIPSGQQQGGDARLRGLASQLGLGDVPLGGGGAGASPDFIIRIASSTIVRRRLLEDSVEVPAAGRRPLLDVVLPRDEAGIEPPAERELRARRALRRLRRWIALRKSDKLDAVDVSVSTPWPRVSLQVTQGLLAGLDAYTLELGRETAHNERRFVEQRISERDDQLRLAESRLASFLRSNREFRMSPNLVFEHDRLEREVSLHQQVLVSLVQSSEEARIRELRDTPTLQVLEPPLLAAERDPSGRAILLAIGFVLGAVAASLVTLVRDAPARMTRADTLPAPSART